MNLFIKSCLGKMFSVIIDSSWTGKKLKEEISIRYKCPIEKQKLEFNSQLLKDQLKLVDQGVKDNSSINLTLIETVRGGGQPIQFTDFSKSQASSYSVNDPKKIEGNYRLISQGINIFGICKNKKCEAYKKEVIFNVLKDEIDLIKENNDEEDEDDITCPLCNNLIKPKTVGFYMCSYRATGKKVENDKIINIEPNIGEHRDEDTVHYYEENLNGKAMFTKIKFEVLKRFPLSE